MLLCIYKSKSVLTDFQNEFTSSVQSTLLYVRTLSISCVLRYWYNYVICILHIMQTCMSNTTVHNEVFSILLPVAFVFPWNWSLCWHSRGRNHTFALSCLCVSGTHIADIAVGLLNNPFHRAIHNCLCSAHNSISVVIGSVSAGHLDQTAPHSLSDLLVKLCQSRQQWHQSRLVCCCGKRGWLWCNGCSIEYNTVHTYTIRTDACTHTIYTYSIFV